MNESSITKMDIIEINNKIAESFPTFYSGINLDYIDSLAKIHTNNDYIIGMQAYLKIVSNININIDSIVDENPELKNSSFVQLAIGTWELRNGDPELGNKYLNKSIELDVKRMNPWVRLELFYYYKYELMDVENSKKILIEALKIQPNFVLAQIERSKFYYESGNFDKGLEILDSLIKNISDPTYVLNSKGFLLIENQLYGEARNCFLLSLKLHENIEAHLGLGYILQYNKHDYNGAKEYYKKAQKIDTASSVVCKRLGLLFLDQNEIDSAITMLKKALDIERIRENYVDLIYAYSLSKNYNEAMELTSEAIKKFGNNIDLDFWEILLLSQTEKQEEAQAKIYLFFEKYNDQEKEWLKKELTAWGIKISKR